RRNSAVPLRAIASSSASDASEPGFDRSRARSGVITLRLPSFSSATVRKTLTASPIQAVSGEASAAWKGTTTTPFFGGAAACAAGQGAGGPGPPGGKKDAQPAA